MRSGVAASASSADGMTPFGGVKNAEAPPERSTIRRRRAISLRVALRGRFCGACDRVFGPRKKAGVARNPFQNFYELGHGAQLILPARTSSAGSSRKNLHRWKRNRRSQKRNNLPRCIFLQDQSGLVAIRVARRCRPISRASAAEEDNFAVIGLAVSTGLGCSRALASTMRKMNAKSLDDSARQSGIGGRN